VRHADAASRKAWQDDDVLRPLTTKGERQAAALVRLLDGVTIRRVLSSPAVRCVQTVQPLAEERGLAVERTDLLAEGAPLDTAWKLLRTEAAQGAAVLCAHGDLIPDLLDEVRREGASCDAPQWAKGSTWALAWDGDRFTTATYFPPQSA